jgi:hypothetical protein
VIVVTAGGVTLGLYLLARRLIPWWPGLKGLMSDPRGAVVDLIPFAFGWAYGALVTVSVMGLIGWIGDTIVWVSSWLGDAALWIGVGADAGVSAQGNYLPLTTQGTYIVLLLTGIVLLVIKFRKSGPEMKLGTWCGALLGTSAGVAGFTAVPLAQAANWLGATVYGHV